MPKTADHRLSRGVLTVLLKATDRPTAGRSRARPRPTQGLPPDLPPHTADRQARALTAGLQAPVQARKAGPTPAPLPHTAAEVQAPDQVPTAGLLQAAVQDRPTAGLPTAAAALVRALQGAVPATRVAVTAVLPRELPDRLLPLPAEGKQKEFSPEKITGTAVDPRPGILRAIH